MLGEERNRPQPAFNGVIGQKAIGQKFSADWHGEDFVAATTDDRVCGDFWDPLVDYRRVKLSDDVNKAKIDYDGDRYVDLKFDNYYFISPDELVNIGDAPTEDWVISTKLPDFFANAAENPYAFNYSPIITIDLADRRAGWILDLLEVTNSRRRANLKSQFKEIFAANPYIATFRALSDLALLGATADELLTANELRELWASTPIWWSVRKRGNVIRSDQGATMLSWRKAWNFISASGETVAEEIIDSDWFSDWLNLRIGDHCYWQFIDYVADRITFFDHGSLLGPNIVGINRREDEISSINISGIVNNYSRTGALIRTYTDSWVCTVDGREWGDILTPTKTCS